MMEVWISGLKCHRFWRFYFSVYSLVFASIEKIYQTLETVFHRLSKHFEFRQKYSAALHIFHSLLDVWISWWNTVNFLIPFFSFILPVKDCSSGSRKLIVFYDFSQRSFLNFYFVSSGLWPFYIFTVSLVWYISSNMPVNDFYFWIHELLKSLKTWTSREVPQASEIWITNSNLFPALQVIINQD